MIGEVPREPVELEPIETRKISIAILREDNQSKEADEGRKNYEAAAANGQLIAGEACGDPKTSIPLPHKTVFLRSISLSGPKDYRLFADPKIGLAAAVAHIKGTTVERGKMPTGCAGLEEKLKSMGNTEEAQGLAYYVRNNIVHPDPIVQALVTARRIHRESGKPALAAVQDHLTTRIYPVAVFLGGTDYKSAPDLIDLAIKYDPAMLYEDGIPTLKDSDIPDIFREFLDAANAQMKHLLANYSNFREMQEVSNPRMVILSTEPRSLRVRYPQTMSRPGIAFKMHLPRERLESGTISIKSSVLQDIRNQVQYPFSHAIEHFGLADQSFSKTDIFLIEAPEFEIAEDLGRTLAEEPPVKEWLQRTNPFTNQRHQMWVAQSKEGITGKIEPLIVQ